MTKIIWIYLLLCSKLLFSQYVERIQEPVEVVSSRSIYLQSGIVSSIEGSSRSFVEVNLPPNTVRWYYSFTTSIYKKKLARINLMSQLVGLYTNNDGLKGNLQSKIEIPEGSCGIDIYVLDDKNVTPFVKKRNYNHHIEGTVKNTEQAVVVMDDIKDEVLYLGLKNPARFIGVHINIEVVAIVETIIEQEKSAAVLKAELLGYAAKDEYENGNYTMSIAYCEKVNRITKLGWVTSIKGLSQLQLYDTDKALSTFFDAILLIKEQSNAENVFSNLIIELKKIRKEQPSIAEVDKIIKMVEMQIK
ncbi:hypothetical protein GCM10011344_13400 [Dokdonia pacifica]|uniref:Uncharacterized protein n=1 Tax=Dokdonia pacifica TaxID=1627892 RepID=A0A238W8P2_9FLAO|nr:hypothetical protein [Dokdonia pacifica]GGG14081.1 hypothetical protein GCM10011344_13400 [Dokdonia pacifica]SNR42912.1 hypothetical protein SAMN06265376_101809 [Dokdonia pacifica]